MRKIINISVGEFSSKVALGMRFLSIWEFRLILCLSIMVAVGSAIFTAYEFGYISAKEDSISLYNLPKASDSDFPGRLNILHASIAVAFTIAAIGLWLRRATSLIILALAAAWVGAVYLWWCFDSLAYLRGLEIPAYTSEIDHIGVLRSAVWWDIVVLLIVIMLLIWMVRMIVISIRLYESNNSIKP